MCNVRNVVKLEGKGGFKAIQVRQMTLIPVAVGCGNYDCERDYLL